LFVVGCFVSRGVYLDVGALYDPVKAKLGVAVGVALAYMTGRETYVISPYVDQTLQMKMEFQRTFHEHRDLPLQFLTVQRALGREAFNIVAVLGKEYVGKVEEPTIYFKEPELLNVELTRNQGPLFIIGRLRKLYSQAGEANRQLRTTRYVPIRDMIQELLRLVGVDVKRVQEGGRRRGLLQVVRTSISLYATATYVQTTVPSTLLMGFERRKGHSS